MTDPLLNVRSLRVCYGQSEVIGSLSLSASKGEILAVMGLNGMGKTTLMKALIGLLSPRAGTVSLDGTDITGAEPYQRVARGLAYVPQGRMVFATLTVEENIQTGLRPSERDVPPEIYGFFPVLEEMRRRRAGNLSGTCDRDHSVEVPWGSGDICRAHPYARDLHQVFRQIALIACDHHRSRGGHQLLSIADARRRRRRDGALIAREHDREGVRHVLLPDSGTSVEVCDVHREHTRR